MKVNCKTILKKEENVTRYQNVGCTITHCKEQDLNKYEIPINVKKAIRMLTKNSSYNEEDYQKMYIMRQSKLTYKQIGLEFGISVEAIRQKLSRIDRFASRFSC